MTAQWTVPDGWKNVKRGGTDQAIERRDECSINECS